MLKILLCFIVTIAAAHNGGQHEESALTPEGSPYELVEVMVTLKGRPNSDDLVNFLQKTPWSEVLPALRYRREVDVAPSPDAFDTGVSVQVKRVSRIVTCAVLVLSALVEVITYFIELNSAP